MGLKEHYQEFKRKLYVEGAFSFANFTLLNGIFLVGFAMALGADNFQLGILLAIPLFANLVQLISAYILEMTGTKKWTTLISLFLGRFVWVIVVILALGFMKGTTPIIILGIVLILTSFLTAVGNLSLLSWMKDLIPLRRLARFLGKRNVYATVGGIIVYLAGAYLIDRFKGLTTYGYLFFFAIIIGLIATVFLRNIPEKKEKIKAIHPKKFLGRLSLPFKDKNFRPLLYFGLFWGLAVNVAGPFFMVFMLKDLGLSFFIVSIFLVIDTIFRVYGLNVWGNIADKFGAKPTLAITATIVSLTPFWFIFINRQYYLFIPLILIISALSFSGVEIALSQILFKSASRKYDAYYFSAFSSLTGLISAIGPILGGFLSVSINGIPQLRLLIPLKWVFLISFILRASCVPLIAKIVEPRAREVNDVLNRIKTLKFASLFVNVYSISDYISKIVLVPQKQLFTLQRKAAKTIGKDLSIMLLLLSKIKTSLSNLSRDNINYYKNRISALNKNLKAHIIKTPYLKDTKFKQIPEKVLSKTEALEKAFETESKTAVEQKAKELKKAVKESEEKLEKVYKKEMNKELSAEKSTQKI